MRRPARGGAVSARPDPRRERLVGLLVLGIAVVLLVSSVTWFTARSAAEPVPQPVAQLTGQVMPVG